MADDRDRTVLGAPPMSAEKSPNGSRDATGGIAIAEHRHGGCGKE
jgi:hypothetical protein